MIECCVNNLLQLRQQNEEQFANLNLDWPPDVQHRPQAVSSPNEMSQILEASPLDVTHEQQHLVRHGFIINLLNTKRSLLYIRNQFVPRSKHFPPLL